VGIALWLAQQVLNMINSYHDTMKIRAPLAGLRLRLKRLRLWLWQNNGFFGEAEAIL
jgi:hypothetical protein